MLLPLAFSAPAPVLANDELPLEGYFMSFATCYGRSYSLNHLNEHPDQKVVDIAFSHFPYKQQLLGPSDSFHPYPETPRFVARLDVWIKGQNNGWQTEAICEPEGDRLKCSIECDGGRFFVQEHRTGKLLLTGGNDLSFDQCDAGDRMLMREPDDQSFLLETIPLSHCRAE